MASNRLEAVSYSTTDRTSRPRDRQPWGSQNTTCAERVPRLCASLPAFRLDLGKSLRASPASGGGTFVGQRIRHDARLCSSLCAVPRGSHA